MIKSKNPQLHKNDNESGILLIEFAIYFPLVFLAFLIFIISSLLITQRVVLDRAVSQATSEASYWLGSSMGRVGYDPFSGGNINIRLNPYANLWHSVANREAHLYSPFASREDFNAAVGERVIELANDGIIGGLGGSIEVTVVYRDFFIAGDLNVTANQRLNLPIFGFGITGFDLESQATARVFHPHALINDVHFIFGFVEDMYNAAVGYVTEVITEKINNVVNSLADVLVNAIENLINDLLRAATNAFW